MNSLPYLIVLFLLFILYLGEQRKIKYVKPKYAIWAAFLLILVFIGLRGHIMSDFILYYPRYNHLPTLDTFFNNFTGMYAVEPAFFIYSSFIKTLGFDYYGWVFINTLIDMVVLFWFFRKYSPSVILALIFFFAFNGLLIEFNLYRNVKGLDCFLLSVPFLLDRKIWPYMLLNLLGIMFHNSSILYLPLYFIFNLKLNNYFIWTMVIVSNLIFLAQIHIVSNVISYIPFIQNLEMYEKISGYVAKKQEYGLSFGYLERLFAIVLFTLLRGKLVKADKRNNFFYNSYFFYYISITIFYEVEVFVDRIPYLFIYSYWILYPKVLSLRYKYRKVMKYAIALLVVMKVYATGSAPGAQYQNILWDKVSYKTSASQARKALKQTNRKS